MNIIILHTAIIYEKKYYNNTNETNATIFKQITEENKYNISYIF